MAKMGRKPIEIDQKQFEKLCWLQCTIQEVCGFLDVSDKTLNKWCKNTYGETFSEVFAKKRVGGMISLRRNQFKLAEKNAAMAIFLGKNYLGQKDFKGVEVKGDDNLSKLDEVLEKIEGVI